MASAGRYPIVRGSGTLASVLAKVVEQPRPENPLAFAKWLKSSGLSSSYFDDVPVWAKFVVLIDKDGSTDLWSRLRDEEAGRSALHEALLTAYAPIFQHFGLTTVTDSDRQRVVAFIRSNENASTEAAEGATDTLIRALDWAEGRASAPPVRPEPKPAEKTAPSRQKAAAKASAPVRQPVQVGAGPTAGFNVSLNVQIVLPPDAEDERYDVMIGALVRHLRSLS